MVDLARDFQSQMAFLDDWPDQRATTRAWEDFLTYKDAQRSQISGVRREILESWSRCLDSGIDAHSQLAPLDTNHDLEEARRRNAELRSAAGLSREVMLMGMGSHFEIWNAATLAEQEQQAIAGGTPDVLSNFSF